MEYVFDKITDCLQVYYSSLVNCIRVLGEETGINHSRYIFQSKCSECHRNAHRNKIESMMNSMTLASHKPDLSELSKITQEMEETRKTTEDIELNFLID